AALLFSEDAARVRLASGGAVTARLAIAAEGRDSPARDALGIRARRVDYGQQALVFWVAHGRPHAQVSTETWRDGGPFTLVPLPDAPDAPLERRHRSSVVWMVSNAEAAELTALDAQDFGLAATARSLGALGPLTLISERAARPIISMIADRFAGPRAALLGEAAHVVPPIGAQGLNMSLADAADLADRVAAARAAGGDIGAPALLSDYEAARRGDARARVAATAGLNLAAIGALHPIRAARRLGLATLGASSVLRRAAMRYGLGG
ncbi:MAG: FAD-dependent monooxygenase, partial [Pseudomonadota bacterium]